ncbi:hypothetical protein WICMUC_001216 [Wickerhamomyces mucosus]|uniref:Integral membrane bound transporter domain-containing protein n=1 Tax=Wickerhamomyces mucosus TaxID=1378264 RepID=A0A9P8THI8_9ASCO|nr:hypothetical protein WICMUC_001216 [Wickerhamomyces mucosus]
MSRVKAEYQSLGKNRDFETDPLINQDDAKVLRQYQSFMSTASAEQTSFNDISKIIGDRSTNFPRMVRTGSAIFAETGERITRTWNNQQTMGNTLDSGDLEAQPFLTDDNRDYNLMWRFLTFSLSKFNQFSLWFYKTKYQFVLKCSLAYLLASLAVYNTAFSSLIGNSDSKHVVATVAVYFHPSRTFGSMHQSLIFVIIAVIFSFSISLISTSISSQLYINGWVNLSALVNLSFASCSLGFISYMKQRMNHPTFNTACSLASLSVISSIVKEGSQTMDSIPLNRLYSLFKIVCCGCFISVAICYLIVPTSATKKLKKDMNESCKLMSQYLSQIETVFINGSNVNSDELLNGINSKIKKNSTTLTSTLEEAKYELSLVGKETQYHLLVKLVKSIQSLQSQLGGLKGSADMQWYTLHENDSPTNNSSVKSINTISSTRLLGSSLRSEDLPHLSDSVTSLDETSALDASQLFDLFIYYLGPSLKSFCYTIKGVLDGMPFELNEDIPTRSKFHYKNSLRLANDLFKSKYNRAMKKLYNQKIFQSKSSSLEAKIDEEEVAASCGNFASILSEFSRELENVIELLSQFSESLDNDHRSWEWMKFWKSSSSPTKKSPGLNVALQTLNETLQMRTDETDTFDTFSFKLWEFFSFFRKIEVQFGIRVGFGAFVLASLAYLPLTKTIFMEWRGEWALVTYSIIMNKSLGGTTMTVNWRILGTFLGALAAYLLWTISDGNVYVLCLSGWVISIFCFDIVLNWKANNAYGRFILLTYNITALYSYNVTRSEDLEEGDTQEPIIGDIAVHRFLGITAGVIWALIMTVSFLPITARHRLKKGLSILWLRLGIIWNSDPLNYKDETLLGLADQRGINYIMRELELLLKQAPKETRLKGKFRSDIYSKLMQSTEKIIDSYQNINTMIALDPKLTENELIVLNITRQEREELQNRIFLIFYMVSSSITLGIPLPSKPASTEHSKDRIMVKLGEIRKEKLLKDEDYVLLYSYVLISNVITRELNNVIKLLGDLYGLVNEETLEI